MKYVIYLRVSTKKQDTKTQLQMCFDFLYKNIGKEFDHVVYTDEITSKRPLHKREGMRQALHSIKRGDVLVGQRVDRLARLSYETHFIKQFLDAKGAELMLTEQPGIKNKVIFGTYIGIAEEEGNLIRERTRNKLNAKKQRGERTGTVLYGYDLDKKNLIQVNGPDHSKVLKPGLLILESHEQVVLSEMSKLFDEGNSYRQIAHILTSLGYMNRQGNPFQHMSIYRILRRTGRTRSSDQPQEETEFQTFHSLLQ